MTDTDQPTTGAALANDLETDDLRYLIKLADWAAGQGFCQLPDMEDPEDWLYRRFTELGMSPDEEYTSDKFLAALRAPAQVEAKDAALQKAITWFDDYALQHFSKQQASDDADEQVSRFNKARTNQNRANELRKALTRPTAAPDDEEVWLLEETLGALEGRHGNGWINITMDERRLFAKLLRAYLTRKGAA